MGHQKFIYNAKVQEQDYWYRFEKKSLSLTGLKPSADQAYSHFKSEELTPWLSQVPSQILRNGAYRFANANARFHKGLGGAPKVKPKFGRKSVLITNELFEYRERAHPRPLNDGPAPFDLVLGTLKFPVGKLKVKAHVPCAHPSTITISEESSGEWFVSFCCELPSMEPSQEPLMVRSHEELMYEYAVRTDLQSITVGIDRGVAIPVADSKGNAFDIHPACRKRMARKDRQIKRYQRRMARQIKGSCNYRKNKRKIAKLKGYAANVRKDFAHKSSFALVNSDAQVLVFEALKLNNMTAAPKAKVDPNNGRFIRNGAAAKAGLNKSMLSSALGLVKQFASYKAAAVNKLVLSVPAHFTSQECSACHHVDAANRVSQALFHCVSCGHTANADMNAAKVIKHRGIQALQKHLQALDAGTVKARTRKAVRVRRAAQLSTVGQVVSEPVADILLPTLVESASDAANDSFVYGAMLVDTRNPHLGLRSGGG
jgi:putative transposase